MPTININRALRPRHPLDTPRIRRVAGRVVIHPLSDVEVERLWETYSRDHAAGDGWLPVIEASLKLFEDWLKR